MKHAKGEWVARPPSAARPTADFAQPAGCGGATQASRIPASPLAGGYPSARCARLSAAAPNELFHGKSSPAFTLIEVLVVIAIAGVAASVISISLNNADRQTEREIERLRLVLEAAAEQAEIQGTPLRLELSPRGYGFSRLDFSGTWSPLERDSTLAKRSLPPAMGWQGLEVNGQAARHLVFGSTMPSFALHIDAPGAGGGGERNGEGSGNVTLVSVPTGAVRRVGMERAGQ